MSGVKHVQVELFIGGKGPCHVFKAPLRGWDENRLDLEAIMAAHKLRNLYAFSLVNGRGNRLLYNPRNGLSHIAYSGKPDVVIRLDGDLAVSAGTLNHHTSSMLCYEHTHGPRTHIICILYDDR